MTFISGITGWRHCRGDDQQVTETLRRNKDFVPPTETLKEVIKHRPPVAQVVKEITEESERDKLRQRRRQAEAELSHSTVQAEAAKEDDEAQKIYREILDVVGSAPCGRGRMVGYGEEAQTTLRRGDRNNAARLGNRTGQARHHNRSVLSFVCLFVFFWVCILLQYDLQPNLVNDVV